MKTLPYLRKKIDSIDIKIARLLKKRYKIVEEIGYIKKKNNISTFQKNRETYLTSNLVKYCNGDKKLQKYIISIFKSVFKESRDLQIKKKMIK